MTINSLSHTTWNCKNHIVFAPKYRRKIFLQEYRVEMGKILRELCDWKGIKIIKTEICPDYVHMFVEIQPQMSVSSFMGYLKGKKQCYIPRKTRKSNYYNDVWHYVYPHS